MISGASNGAAALGGFGMEFAGGGTSLDVGWSNRPSKVGSPCSVVIAAGPSEFEVGFGSDDKIETPLVFASNVRRDGLINKSFELDMDSDGKIALGALIARNCGSGLACGSI